MARYSLKIETSEKIISLGGSRHQSPCFTKFFSYHNRKDGAFGTVHDVGAGNGPCARKLRYRLAPDIVSDIVEDKVELARPHLGTVPRVASASASTSCTRRTT